MMRRCLTGLSALLGVLAMGFLTGASAAPTLEPGVGLPRDISLEGHRIDWLLQVTNFFIVLLFAIMCAWMLIAALRHTRKSKPKADYDHGTSRHSVVVAMALSVVVFLVVDGNLFYNAIVDLNEAFWNWERAEGSDAVRVEVNARQWAWQIRYPGVDGTFATADDVVTLNDLVVPADRPVAVQLRSVDVIHSFYLPNVRVKTDAIPGNTTKLWFQVDSQRLAEAGGNEFDLACAQHCGTHHYKMKGAMRVLTPEAFEQWLSEASANAALDYEAPATPEQVAQGTHLAPKYSGHWGWPWQEI